jgi:hypothetical protein
MTTTRWTGAHIQFYQFNAMRNWISLDNQSAATIFCNPKMVSNIQDTNETLALMTNAGVLLTIMKANLLGWGEVWYNPKAVTNIFSLAQMVDRHPVTYNSTKNDTFIVHLPDKQVKFQASQVPMQSKWTLAIFTSCLISQSLELALKPSLLILWKRTGSSIHSISLNKPRELENYFILSEPR